MKLLPVSDHIVVKPVEKETKTAAGIIIPDTAQKERPERGEVVAVGNGKWMENGERAPMEAKVGDTVLFKKYAPDEIEVDGKTFFIIRNDDVMAILE